MEEIKKVPQDTPTESPDILSETVDADDKKKKLDDMIEVFNRDNPARNLKKIYRGVF